MHLMNLNFIISILQSCGLLPDETDYESLRCGYSSNNQDLKYKNNEWKERRYSVWKPIFIL